MSVHRQRGVALLTAILVVALATVAAAALTSRQQLEIRRNGAVWSFEQARHHAVGLEYWAAGVLARDRKKGERDHLGEAWSAPLEAVEVAGGEVSAWIEERHGCFNLNNVEGGGEALNRFRRLLGLLGLEPGLADTLADWIDADSERRWPNGAEDEAYLDLDAPYRAANRPLAAVEELRRVKGFEGDAFDALAPHVCVLPERTAINLNTASAVVLRTLADGIEEGEAEALLEARGEEGFESMETFLQLPALAGRQVNQTGLALAGDWFAVRGEARVDRARIRFESLLRREAGGATRVVRRRRVVE